MPPAAGPAAGEIPVIVGMFVYVNAPVPVTVWPSLLVITTSRAPAVPAGVTAVIIVPSIRITFVAATLPIVTPNEPPSTKFPPMIVTAVPPSIGPEFGVMLVNVGPAVYVYAPVAVTN